MDRRTFCGFGVATAVVGCGASEMPQEFTLQQSPVRTAHRNDTQIPVYGNGVWTPRLLFGGGNSGMTFSRQQGGWIRNGQMVTIWLDMALSAKGSSTGTATIEDLPFVALNHDYNITGAVGVALWTGMTSSLIIATVNAASNGVTGRALTVRGSTAGTTSLNVLTHADFADTSEFGANVTYIAR
jgi:hypothetical protein